MQNQTISELYTDDNKLKYSSNPKGIIKSAKTFMKNFTPRIQLPKLLLLNFSAKFPTERKYIINDLSFVGQKSLDEIIKSINLHK